MLSETSTHTCYLHAIVSFLTLARPLLHPPHPSDGPHQSLEVWHLVHANDGSVHVAFPTFRLHNNDPSRFRALRPWPSFVHLSKSWSTYSKRFPFLDSDIRFEFFVSLRCRKKRQTSSPPVARNVTFLARKLHRFIVRETSVLSEVEHVGTNFRMLGYLRVVVCDAHSCYAFMGTSRYESVCDLPPFTFYRCGRDLCGMYCHAEKCVQPS